MLSTKTYSGTNFIEGSKIVLNNSLYEDGWLMKPFLEKVINNEISLRTCNMVIGHVEHMPVAVALSDGLQAMVFCNPLYRGQGFTQECWDLMIKAYPSNKRFWVGEGNEESFSFWKKQGYLVDRNIEVNHSL